MKVTHYLWNKKCWWKKYNFSN